MTTMSTPIRSSRHPIHRRRRGRSSPSTILLYASMLALIAIALVLWQSWKKDRGKLEPAKTTSQPIILPTPPPATAPTTAASAPTSRPTPRWPTSNISPAAIPLTDTERIAISDVTDNVETLDETGFYILLGHAAKMRKLSGEEFDALSRPGEALLLQQPAFFRAQTMRVQMRVFQVQEISVAGGGLSPSRHWPPDKPLWRLDGLSVVPKGAVVHDLMVFCTEDPTPLLGEPKKTTREGTMEYYGTGRRLDLAAIFYKVTVKKDQHGNLRQYPVFLAWQFSGRSGGGQFPTAVVYIFGVLLVLLIGFVFLKRYLRQVKRIDATPGPRPYRPLRELTSREKRQFGMAGEAEVEDEDEPEDTEVDPLLKQAAEEYHRDQLERQRQQEDGEDDNG